MSNLQKGQKNLLRALKSVFLTYQIQLLDESNYLKVFGDFFVLIHKSSPILKSIEAKENPLLNVYALDPELNVFLAPIFSTFMKIKKKI